MSKKRRNPMHDYQWNVRPTQARPESPVPSLQPGDAVILAGTESSGWANRLPRRPWVVVECLCGLCEQGSHVALDVPRSPEMLEMYPESGLWTHVRTTALRRRGEPSRRQAEAWAYVMAGQGLGNKLGVVCENGGENSARTARAEFAALALCDSLGGTDLTDAQARQLDWWRDQDGGDLTPSQLEQVREWQRARGGSK